MEKYTIYLFILTDETNSDDITNMLDIFYIV